MGTKKFLAGQIWLLGLKTCLEKRNWTGKWFIWPEKVMYFFIFENSCIHTRFVTTLSLVKGHQITHFNIPFENYQWGRGLSM